MVTCLIFNNYSNYTCRYIPLPEGHARASIIKNLLSQQKNILKEDDIEELVKLTQGYSGFDVDGLVREAALGLSLT